MCGHLKINEPLNITISAAYMATKVIGLISNPAIGDKIHIRLQIVGLHRLLDYTECWIA